MDNDFDQGLDTAVLPSGIQSVTFGDGFNCIRVCFIVAMVFVEFRHWRYVLVVVCKMPFFLYSLMRAWPSMSYRAWTLVVERLLGVWLHVARSASL